MLHLASVDSHIPRHLDRLAVRQMAHADHGDDRASATRVELPSDTSGEIDPGDDEDWFRRGGPKTSSSG